MSYKISEDGQLSTVQNEDGSPVNLFEQELIALRVTMDVAFHIADDNAFAKLTGGKAAETVINLRRSDTWLIHTKWYDRL